MKTKNCLAFKINKNRIFIGKHSACNSAFRVRKVYGTFEKRTPGLYLERRRQWIKRQLVTLVLVTSVIKTSPASLWPDCHATRSQDLTWTSRLSKEIRCRACGIHNTRFSGARARNARHAKVRRTTSSRTGLLQLQFDLKGNNLWDTYLGKFCYKS